MNLPPASTRSRWLIVAAWIVVALAALPFALRVNDELDAAARLEHSESGRVEAALQRQFESPFAKIALLRIAGAPSPRTPDGQALLERVIKEIRNTPGVRGVMSYLDRRDSLFLGQDGSPILIVGLNAPKGTEDALIAKLAASTDAFRVELEPKYPDLSFGWTGEAAVNADLRRISAEETRAAEWRVFPLTLVLLLIAFRSVISAVLPVLCGALTIVVSLGAVAAVNRIWPASLIVVSIISMVGLGLSIDYALLIVSRYRDGLEQGLSRPEALSQAARRGGRTVLVSGTAVAIGFAAMLFVRVSEVSSIGFGGLLVTSVAVLVAVTLLPVVLAWIGPWVDKGSLGLGRKPDTGRNWRRWARWVLRHPWAVLAVAGIPLVALAAQAVHLRIDLPRGRWLPESAESVHVLHEIDSVARGSFGEIIQVILYLPPGTTVQEESGWRAESRLARYFARDPRVHHVWAATTLSTMPLAGPEVLARIPDAERRSLVSADGRAVLLVLLPRQNIAATDAMRLVREIRAANPQTLTGLAGTRLEVGGLPGFNTDYEDAIKSALGPVIASVIGATLLVLSLAFRSVLIPLKAVALNLLAVAGAYGAVAIVFQHGLGSRLVGLPSPMHGGFPILPMVVFCIVFGLSMDYEVFIVARIADGRRAGLADGAALVEALASTGRVITFAASIMVMIFGAFVFGDFVLIKILGFALAVAVFLDATVIRLAVGPALVRLAGRWNWWPGPARRNDPGERG
ncbi:MAG TPA: MMPL family transporter [Steroidobacteraceae bacterium]|nr:MMPL family transporter [Steroidobacteraceae bacterium]